MRWNNFDMGPLMRKELQNSNKWNTSHKLAVNAKQFLSGADTWFHPHIMEYEQM